MTGVSPLINRVSSLNISAKDSSLALTSLMSSAWSVGSILRHLISGVHGVRYSTCCWALRMIMDNLPMASQFLTTWVICIWLSTSRAGNSSWSGPSEDFWSSCLSLTSWSFLLWIFEPSRDLSLPQADLSRDLSEELDLASRSSLNLELLVPTKIGPSPSIDSSETSAVLRSGILGS